MKKRAKLDAASESPAPRGNAKKSVGVLTART